MSTAGIYFAKMSLLFGGIGILMVILLPHPLWYIAFAGQALMLLMSGITDIQLHKVTP